MKRFLVSLVFLGALLLGYHRSAGCVLQQNKPDLTGKWALDMSRLESSSLGEKTKPTLYDAMTLVISYRDPEFRITRQWTKKGKERQQELVFYIDGRGEKNPSTAGGSTNRSHTNLEGNKIITRWKEEFSDSGRFMFCDFTDIWELSDDGQTLVQFSTVSGERVPGVALICAGETKRIFKRIVEPVTKQ
jgi:hypothetical protein